MNERLSFLISNEVIKLFDHFTALFDIRIAFFTPTGEELKVGLNRCWCDYCKLLRTRLGDDSLCVASDRGGREQALSKKDMVNYVCHGGLIEAVKPIYAEEELLGFVMIGQVRTEASPPAGKAERWTRKFADMELLTAWCKVPWYPKAKLYHTLHLFSALTDLIVSRHMVTVLGRHHLDEVHRRMEAHPEEPLTLLEAARLIGRSVDRTAHLFTEVYGKSFKTLQTEYRMRKGATLLTESKTLGIKEIAALCGYDDPLYFSRVFRNHFGLSPSALRSVTG